ncbi:glycoside hydrolase family 65 protein [Ornithinibacillus sp. L9]|uniref:Glycoside hydrolase family 65 protein n=1 Tax=Ornithinibacillus caprae TaxID=2678566 RepID=A0A6N8FNQ1_9BACI|nr:glycosyl hydrolase family 65 protein [Ornithinibacillus caprae]MUK89419.1 glycoside hydrolase family 65 protein [Ornithinibacillus caprae]
MIEYSLGKDEFKDWLVSEVEFSPDSLGKCESIMYLGNGYMGLRSVTEEPYLKETRNLLVSGTFNKAAKNEVTELPNLADITRLDIRVDGERFSLELGQTSSYLRQLNLKTAELTREVEWVSPKGKELRFYFRRFVSLDNLHLIGMKMEVEALNDPVQLSFDSGVNAQMSNSGAQHFLEGERRIYNRRFIELIQTTNQSNVDIAINTTHKLMLNDKELSLDPDMDMGRRKVWLTFNVSLEPGDVFTSEKITTIHTSRDKEFDKPGYEIGKLRDFAHNELKESALKGYDKLFDSHVRVWQEKVWEAYDFEVDSKHTFDQLAIRFALYHLTIMTPAHDDRMGIGAKALSGQGYKGHSFWDTEIFILPFFTYSNPQIARSLLTYRYRGLAGARKKAIENGYKGAMYPWEAAWPTDGEVTPAWGDVDIVTGEQTKIWSGLIEQHITSDIAFAIYQYYVVTNDQDFMDDYGYEMIFDTANFWASRLEWNDDNQEYHINDVIGPDEYKEHVNNNAYTNHMTYFNLRLAIQFYELLQTENPARFKQLNELLRLDPNYRDWKLKAENLYLPSPRKEDLIIPQDDTYLSLKQIDLSRYKNQKQVRGIYKDYNPEQINQLQVTKQADVLVLLYLLEQTFLNEDQRFSYEVKESNFNFYEPKTLHDSSLSLATHAILANDIEKGELAYSLFKEASEIDLGPSMQTSDDGVHAASIGGIWSAAVFGFAGVRISCNGRLKLNPCIPKHWNKMKFTIYWHGQPLFITITQETLSVVAVNKELVELEVFGKVYTCEDHMEIPISSANE